MPDNKREQCLMIKILHGMNLASKQFHRRLVATHNQQAYLLSSVHWWVNHFAAGKVNVGDCTRLGHPTKLTPVLLNQLVGILRREPRTSLATLARYLQVSVGTMHKALTKQLHWKKHPARWVPHHLTDVQRNRRVICCHTLLHLKAGNCDFLQSIVTMDESWFFCYDPASHQASCEWVAPGAERPHIPWLERVTMKIMMSVFWDSQGVIFREFIPRGQGVTAHVHLRMLRKLCEKLHHC